MRGYSLPMSGPGKPHRVYRLAGRLNIGGPARQILPLCRDLDPEEFQTTLAFGNPDPREGEWLEPFLENQVFLQRIPRLGRSIRPWRDFRVLLHLWSTLRRERPRIFHSHLAKAGALGRLAAWLARVPVRIHHYHGLNFQGHFGSGRGPLSRWAEKFLSLLSTRVIAVSESVRSELLTYRIAPDRKIVVLTPGLDLEPFLKIEHRAGKLRRALGVTEEEFLIGFVGRLAPVKNPDDFLAMAAGISLARPRTRFVFLGDGPLRDEIAGKVHSLDLASRVALPGWQKDMPEALSDLDLVVATSRSEGMPLALIEAMASGLPVVARNVGGVGELIRQEENGLLVAPGSEEGLEKAVLEILADRDKARSLGRQAREDVRKTFSAHRLVSGVENLYRKCLEEKGI